MIDIEAITTRLDKLQEYTRYLTEYQKCSLDQLKKDYTLQGAVLHYLQLSIESIIDIGELLISGLKLRKPNDSGEVIIILGEQGALAEDFVKRFLSAISFRNLLVHEYIAVDIARVYAHLQNDLRDFDLFSRAIATYLKNKSTI